MPKKRLRPTDSEPGPIPEPEPEPKPEPEPESIPIKPPKRMRFEDAGTLDQLTYTMACVARFALRHHNAEEHICAYASNVCENGGTGGRVAFLNWLVWLHEVD